MIQQTPQADRLKQQLRDSLQRETLNSRAVKIATHTNVYKRNEDSTRSFRSVLFFEVMKEERHQNKSQ